MKKSLLFKTMLLLCALVAGSGSVWADTEVLSWSRNGSNYSVVSTDGYTVTYVKASAPSSKNYYQDSGTADTDINSITMYRTDTKLFTTSPASISFTAKLGGGSTRDLLDYYIYACFVDKTGADIADTEVTVTTKITSTTGSNFTVSMPTAKATDAYGVKIYHKKQNGWNARYYSFSLSYSNQVDATWSLAPTSATVTVGESTILDLTTNYDGTLTFESEDEDIATVSYDSSTKEITVNGIAVGTTTINVTGAATSNYKPISKSISVVIQKALAANCIMYDSFDSNDSSGGNDGTWSGLSGTPTPLFDLTGWTYETTYGASKCVRIGKNGYFLSPAIGVAGNITLKFKVEAWGTDTGSGYVDIVGGGTFDDSESITGVTLQESNTRAKVTLQKNGTWTEYTLTIIGVTTSSKIKFFGPSDKRIFFDEFEVILDKQTVAIASSGYSTLASVRGLDFASATPAGLEAYVASDISASGIILSAIDEAPASTGVILKGTAGETYTIPVKDNATAVGTNYLKASTTATPLADGSFYIMKGGKFCLVTGAADEAARTVPAGKAYLLAEDVPVSSAPEFLGFIFDLGGETTGINAVNGSKLTVNGSQVYNLNGQRVANPTKGLYIVNGRKVAIK